MEITHCFHSSARNAAPATDTSCDSSPAIPAQNCHEGNGHTATDVWFQARRSASRGRHGRKRLKCGISRPIVVLGFSSCRSTCRFWLLKPATLVGGAIAESVDPRSHVPIQDSFLDPCAVHCLCCSTHMISTPSGAQSSAFRPVQGVRQRPFCGFNLRPLGNERCVSLLDHSQNLVLSVGVDVEYILPLSSESVARITMA